MKSSMIVSPLLQNRILEWAEKKEILQKGNILAQSKKVQEEASEVIEALEAYCDELKKPIDHQDHSKLSHVMEEIGDLQVTLVIARKLTVQLCSVLSFDPDECLLLALHKIEGRTGKMVDGTFQKDGK